MKSAKIKIWQIKAQLKEHFISNKYPWCWRWTLLIPVYFFSLQTLFIVTESHPFFIRQYGKLYASKTWHVKIIEVNICVKSV